MSHCAHQVVQPEGVVHCTFYDAGGKPHPVPLDDINEQLEKKTEGFIWLALYGPDQTLLEGLKQEFGLHDLAIEDAGSAQQRPKMELYGDSLFVTVNTAQVVDAKVVYGETHAFVGKRFIVTVRHGTSLPYDGVKERIEREPELLVLGPSYVLYAVLDFIVDNYLPIARQFRTTLKDLERVIVADNYERRTIILLYDLKRRLAEMRMAVSPVQDMLSQLQRSTSSLIEDDVRIYIRDVHDHTIRINDLMGVIDNMLDTALHVNLSLVTLAQGETVKKLGAWAALLAAPTLITSWYGMNFHAMPELDGRYAYPILIGVIALACGLLYRLFKRARWL